MTLQSEVQASLTKQLINKIGAFNDTHQGQLAFVLAFKTFGQVAHFLLGSLSGEDLGVGSLGNIHNLSLELEQHVRTFSCVMFLVTTV